MKPMPHAVKSDAFATRQAGATVEAFFSYGFRPFFLGAALFAALLMAVWIAWIGMTAAGLGGDWLPVAGSAYAWHAHEMVFGFAAAAVAGFLLTAVPNWTGALPLSGAPLMVLFAVWLAGRLAVVMSGVLPLALVAAVDCSFLPLLGAFAARQLMVKPQPRNMVFLAILAALTLSSAGYHAGVAGFMSIDPTASVRFGVLILVVMVAVIGGRIIPAFTHNWLNMNARHEPMPERSARLDAAAILSLALFAVAELLGAPDALLGAVALTTALLNAWRLALWRGWATRSEPIVWILHLGYLWIVAGLVLAAAGTVTEWVPRSLSTHAFGTGAVGTMIMAVMTRASLGHTGRPIVAPRPIVWAYLLVTAAAVLRVVAPIVAPQHTGPALAAAGLFWVAAFALFVIVYAPILTTPRVHTKLARA